MGNKRLGIGGLEVLKMDKKIYKEKGNCNVKNFFLFGSRARGDFLEDSDYDFIVVSPDFKDVFFSQRVRRVSDFWDYLPLEVDVLCYTPEEFERMKGRIGIVQTALEEGISF